MDGARGHSNHSKSPARAPYRGNTYNSYDGLNQRMGTYRTHGWDTERRGLDMQSGHSFEQSVLPQSLEEIELEYKREVTELGKICDKEEDEENYKHREAVKELRESYMKKLSVLRGTHAKRWEEFLHLDAQRRLEQARQQMFSSGFGGCKQPGYPESDNPGGNASYGRPNISMDSRGRYPNTMDNYPSSRPHDTYGQFQHQGHEDYGKAYNRY